MVKEDKAKALDMFNKGEGGFKDRDLYVYCANGSDGIITATPYWNRGKPLKEIRGKHGAPFGETIMQNATEGTIKETTYWWRALVQTNPSRRRSSTRRSVTRFVLSATTKNKLPGTCYWHLADEGESERSKTLAGSLDQTRSPKGRSGDY